MPRLSLKTGRLFRDRLSQIRALLKAVASDPSGLQIRAQKHAAGQIISVSDLFSASDSPTDRLFKTTSDRLYGQYYEIWTPDKDVRNYHLYQSYFHLYALPSKTERDQLVCLHAEPEKALDAMASRVQAGPHIHVKSKEDRLLPVAKAHLPVCYSTTDAVLKSVGAFNKELCSAISVIKREIVDRYV